MDLVYLIRKQLALGQTRAQHLLLERARPGSSGIRSCDVLICCETCETCVVCLSGRRLHDALSSTLRCLCSFELRFPAVDFPLVKPRIHIVYNRVMRTVHEYVISSCCGCWPARLACACSSVVCNCEPALTGVL